MVLSSGVYLPEVKAAYIEKLTEYIRSTVFKQSFVSHAIVGSLLLNVGGVVDYSGLTLNGTAANVAVGSYEVPVLGNIEVSI